MPIARISIIFIVLFSSYFIVDILFLPHNHFIGFPIYMDDYKAFAYTFQSISWAHPRPIMFLIAPLFASLGITGIYFTMIFGDILICTLTLYFIEKFLNAPLKVFWILCYGIVLFSFPFILDVSKFLGLLINITSSFFGIVSLILLLAALREHKIKFYILSGLFYCLTLYTKEDFILPNFVLLTYLMFFESHDKNHRKSLVLFTCFSLIAVISLFAYNKYVAHSVFTGMGSNEPPYFVNTHVSSILLTTWNYLTSHPYLSLLFTSAISIFIALIALSSSTKQFSLLTLTTLLIIVLTLIAPYSVLPNHFCYFYIFNWLSFETAFIFYGISILIHKFKRLYQHLTFFIFSLLFMVISYPHRESSALMYEKAQTLNRNIIHSLNLHYKELNKEKLIGVTGPGVQSFSPWAICQGEYLQFVLNLTPHWILFIDNPSIETQTQFNPAFVVNTLNSQKIKEFSNIKLLYFDATGKIQ